MHGTHSNEGGWSRFKRRAAETIEAMDMSPTEVLEARLARVEQRLAELEQKEAS
uniref:hypothetical protein n=1 Tax=uncultured Altererythrobacter sp. TaxID=500840 RepID=UPI0026144A58|nr:hypothetical protein [uncultured Altererythrobacter sp.]